MLTRELPQRFGRYHLLSVLGRGGMGTVYLAEDPDASRRIALKVPNFAPDENPEILERFQREARLAARLLHPNLCPVLEVGQIDGLHYLTMPYLEGYTLAQLLRGPCDPLWAVRLVLQIARTMHALHESGVVHRDLKPSNVMVRPDGQPIIMDFGLARALFSISQQLTGPHSVLGTPAYMAPEQVVGKTEEVGPVSDVYSLGVILYEAITGRRPFEGPPAAIFGKVLHVEAAPPSTLRPELPVSLDGVCLKALAKEPAERYPTMQALGIALGGCIRELNGRFPGLPPSPPTRVATTQETVPPVQTPVKTTLPSTVSGSERAISGKGRAKLLVGSVAAVLLCGGGWLFLGKPNDRPAPLPTTPDTDHRHTLARAVDRARQCGDPADRVRAWLAVLDVVRDRPEMMGPECFPKELVLELLENDRDSKLGRPAAGSRQAEELARLYAGVTRLLRQRMVAWESARALPGHRDKVLPALCDQAVQFYRSAENLALRGLILASAEDPDPALIVRDAEAAFALSPRSWPVALLKAIAELQRLRELVDMDQRRVLAQALSVLVDKASQLRPNSGGLALEEATLLDLRLSLAFLKASVEADRSAALAGFRAAVTLAEIYRAESRKLGSDWDEACAEVALARCHLTLFQFTNERADMERAEAALTRSLVGLRGISKGPESVRARLLAWRVAFLGDHEAIPAALRQLEELVEQTQGLVLAEVHLALALVHDSRHRIAVTQGKADPSAFEAAQRHFQQALDLFAARQAVVRQEEVLRWQCLCLRGEMNRLHLSSPDEFRRIVARLERASAEFRKINPETAALFQGCVLMAQNRPSEAREVLLTAARSTRWTAQDQEYRGLVALHLAYLSGLWSTATEEQATEIYRWATLALTYLTASQDRADAHGLAGLTCYTRWVSNRAEITRKAAINHLKQALNLEGEKPKNSLRLYWCLGLANLQLQDDPKAAQSYLEQAELLLRTLPLPESYRADAHGVAGLFHFGSWSKSGDKESHAQALDHLKKALELDNPPSNTQRIYWLMALTSLVGKTDPAAARRYLTEADELLARVRWTEEVKKRVRTQLEQLRSTLPP